METIKKKRKKSQVKPFKHIDGKEKKKIGEG